MHYIFLFVIPFLVFIECRTVSSDSDEDYPELPPITNSFVTVENGNFVLDGKKFHFAGTNAYYLPNFAKIDRRTFEKTLNSFRAAGVSVIRIWGFYDGPPQYDNDITFQPQPGVYNEANLRFLDDLIAKGKRYNMRFIIALSNYWDEMGGMPQYNEWDENPEGGMAHFINDPQIQDLYKKYIHMILNRVNSVTGIAYKNEPAIFSWEIMNEARLPGGNPEELRDWYREIAQFIKSQDTNHMVSTGEEGFESGIGSNLLASKYSVNQYKNKYVLNANEGTSYQLNTAIPEIDYGTAHWYPENWGFRNGSSQEILMAQRAWITDHEKIAKDLGKPFVLGEYGFSGWGSNLMSLIYRDLWNYAEEIQLDGSLLWQLTADSKKCYEFGGNICWPDGRQDRDLFYSFQNHIQNMRDIE